MVCVHLIGKNSNSFEALEGDKYHFLDSGWAFWGSVSMCLPYSYTLPLAFAVGHCWRQSSRFKRTFDLSWYDCYTTLSPLLSIIPNHVLGDHILNKFILCHRIHCCIAWSHTGCVLLCVLHITYIELYFTEDSPPSDSWCFCCKTSVHICPFFFFDFPHLAYAVWYYVSLNAEQLVLL